MTPQEYKTLESLIAKWAIEKTEFLGKEEDYIKNKYNFVGIPPTYFIIGFIILFFLTCK